MTFVISVWPLKVFVVCKRMFKEIDTEGHVKEKNGVLYTLPSSNPILRNSRYLNYLKPRSNVDLTNIDGNGD